MEEDLQSAPVHFSNQAPQTQTNFRHSKAKPVQNILLVPEGGVKSTQKALGCQECQDQCGLLCILTAYL